MLHSPLADSETDVVSCEKMVQSDDPVTDCTPPGGIQQVLLNVMIQRTGEQLLFIPDAPCPPPTLVHFTPSYFSGLPVPLTLLCLCVVCRYDLKTPPWLREAALVHCSRLDLAFEKRRGKGRRSNQEGTENGLSERIRSAAHLDLNREPTGPFSLQGKEF